MKKETCRRRPQRTPLQSAPHTLSSQLTRQLNSSLDSRSRPCDVIGPTTLSTLTLVPGDRSDNSLDSRSCPGDGSESNVLSPPNPHIESLSGDRSESKCGKRLHPALSRCAAKCFHRSSYSPMACTWLAIPPREEACSRQRPPQSHQTPDHDAKHQTTRCFGIGG